MPCLDASGLSLILGFSGEVTDLGQVCLPRFCNSGILFFLSVRFKGWFDLSPNISIPQNVHGSACVF